MRILIIGGVAAGTSAAAKIRRNSEKHEIVIYEQDRDISYSGCGLPYYLEDDSIARSKITPRSPEWFFNRFKIQVQIRHEVLSVHPAEQEIRVKNLSTGEVFSDRYDRLILATGSLPVKPSIPGMDFDSVVVLKSPRHVDEMKSRIQKNQIGRAVILGAGLIGLEMAEALTLKGIQVTLVEREPQVMPGISAELALILEQHLKDKGVELKTGVSASAIEDQGKTVLLSSQERIAADLILAACGVRPNTRLAKKAGIPLGSTGAIAVNQRMQTGIKKIYAAGDCAESFHRITGKPLYRPMGSTANKTGRIAGDAVSGGTLSFQGVLGTAIFKCFDLAVGLCGLSEAEAKAAGFKTETLHLIRPAFSEVFPHSSEITIKVVADRRRGRLLGAEIIGRSGVDKRLDVLATAISLKARVSDLFHLDLGYAPPFSTAKDPVAYAGMVLENSIFRNRRLISAQKLIQKRENYQVVDVRDAEVFEKGHIPGALNIPLRELRQRYQEILPGKKTVVHCNKGNTGNAAQNLLLNLGFKKVYHLSGGFTGYQRVLGSIKKNED